MYIQKINIRIFFWLVTIVIFAPFTYIKSIQYRSKKLLSNILLIITTILIVTKSYNIIYSNSYSVDKITKLFWLSGICGGIYLFYMATVNKDILLALFSCMMIFVKTMNFAGFTWIS